MENRKPEYRKAEEMSSSEARDEVLSQHVKLRVLLAETDAVAKRVAFSGGDLGPLREKAQALYDALAAHMSFEEQVLPTALRDVIGWGDVIQRKMEEDHRRQRETLVAAIAAIGPAGLAGMALIDSVRRFAITLEVDIASEEKGFLEADVDAIVSDSRGG